MEASRTQQKHIQATATEAPAVVLQKCLAHSLVNATINIPHYWVGQEWGNQMCKHRLSLAASRALALHQDESKMAGNKNGPRVAALNMLSAFPPLLRRHLHFECVGAIFNLH